MGNNNQKNNVHLVGKLVAIRQIGHTANSIIYEGIIGILRDSGTIDYILILFNDKYVPNIGSFISVKGQFRSRDVTKDDGKLKVELYVCAQEISNAKEELYVNNVILEGYICKKPTLRNTPSGKQISDLLIACNYNKDKTAYIPVVTWGKYARKSGRYNVGTQVNIIGRLQSRKYTKEINGIIKEFTAYELSASSIEDISFIDD